MRTNICCKVILPLLSMLMACYANGESYKWASNTYTPQTGFLGYFSSPKEACQKYIDSYMVIYEHPGQKAHDLKVIPNSYYPGRFDCSVLVDWPPSRQYDPPQLREFAANRSGDACPLGSEYNPATGCESTTDESQSKKLGMPSEFDGCHPEISSFAGNPINLTNGNKVQRELDYSSKNSPLLKYERYYNSAALSWTGSFSDRLILGGTTISLIKSDLSVVLFSKTTSGYLTDPPSKGKLSYADGKWSYLSPDNTTLIFDGWGKLIGIQKPNTPTLTITYVNDTSLKIADTTGELLTITRNRFGDPLLLETSGLTIDYIYNGFSNIRSVKYTRAGVTSSKSYKYLNTNTGYLTQIIDEKGNALGTWTYDESGKANSSEHPLSSERVLLSYNSDGSTTLTNSYGKKSTYRFQLIKGIKRISSIEGEPTPNCAYSNSTFTYNAHGLLKTRTDAKGNVTTYDYNDRGLETSHTKASGTPQARTITTEWHPTLYLKTKVTEPDQITTYQYDAQGRQVSFSTKAQ